MVEEPFVNLRTAIESTRQAVLLKYYNELLELDPKTQPKQITAVTLCRYARTAQSGTGRATNRQRHRQNDSRGTFAGGICAALPMV